MTVKGFISAAEIAKATSGNIVSGSGNTTFKGVSIDTRSIKAGEAFFAIRGPRFDGHDYIGEAFNNGATVVVVEESADVGKRRDGTVVKVVDTTRALGELAGYIREKFPVPLVAITGTSGKTTTKEMVAAILSNVAGSEEKVLKTEGNRNNLYGVPLTLLGFNGSYMNAVLEIGISVPGEMERLTDITNPDVGLITNIGKGHLEGLGSVEETAREKGALFRGLKDNGVMVVNIDDPLVTEESEAVSNVERVRFGTKSGADVRLTGFTPDGINGSDLVLDIKGDELRLSIKVPGKINAMNAAAAAAASLPLGATLSDIKAGLEAFRPASGRLKVIEEGGLHIIDDTYNANPSSVKAALEILSEVKGRKVAVLGDMLELGAGSEGEHIKIGIFAAKAELDVFFAIGRYSDLFVEGAITGGMDKEKARAFTARHSLVRKLSEKLKAGDTVLIKGSRGSAMEEVLRAVRSINVSE